MFSKYSGNIALWLLEFVIVKPYTFNTKEIFRR